MSLVTRDATAEEAERLWPAVAASHTFGSLQQFLDFHGEEPWRVRVGPHGDAYVVKRWRAHSDVLSMLGVWAPPRRVSGLVGDARAVAAQRGFAFVMSPLVAARSAGPFREAGMDVLERLVAFSVAVGEVRVCDEVRQQVDVATTDDLEDLAALDRACFEELWRHGVPELREALAEGARVTLVRDELGGVAGSAVSALSGSVVTVGRLATAPQARRRGVASALLADASEWAAVRGAIGLSLCTQASNEPARRLYERVGFEPAPDEYLLLIARAR